MEKPTVVQYSVALISLVALAAILTPTEQDRKRLRARKAEKVIRRFGDGVAGDENIYAE